MPRDSALRPGARAVLRSGDPARGTAHHTGWPGPGARGAEPTEQPRIDTESRPMKFLCIPCDSPMKLQSVGPPERGSLSVVYSCPECGYEMAMLTNAFETQIVQSLGVRIGPEIDGGASSRLRAAGAPASLAEALAEAGTSGTRCPFTAMIPATEGAFEGTGHAASTGAAAQPVPVRWTAAAEARLANIP